MLRSPRGRLAVNENTMHLKEFFFVPKSDRAAVVLLLAAVVVAVIALHGLGGGDEATTLAAADSLPSPKRSPGSPPMQAYGEYYQVEGHAAERFFFDPNTADSTQLLRLGLRPWQVRNIYKYRAAGGVYRRAADFARLYGLTVKQFRELEPYIRISSDYLPASRLVSRSPAEAPVYSRDTLLYPQKMQPGETVELNAADTTRLKKVPGIGSWYARQIVYYRERLGGYANREQLLEIEGFPDEALAYFRLEPGSVRRLNLNKLTMSQLRRHPYISFYQAKAICDYRRLKGPLRSLDDLRLLRDFPPAAIARLQP